MNEDSEEGTSFPWNSDQLHDMDRGEFQHESHCSEFKDEEVFESDHDENLIYISETMFSMSDREHDGAAKHGDRSEGKQSHLSESVTACSVRTQQTGGHSHFTD